MASEQSVPLLRHPGDLWLAMEALVWLMSVALLLRLWSLPRLLQWLDRYEVSESPGNPLPENLQQLSRYLDGWLRRSRVRQRPCLYRSLVLFSYLRGKGIAVRFCLGLRTNTEPWKGHAWLQYQDITIDDSSASHEGATQLTYSYPAEINLRMPVESTRPQHP